MKCHFLIPLVLAVQLATTAIHANDIQFSNLTRGGTNTVNATTQVHFDITWANSWSTSGAPAGSTIDSGLLSPCTTYDASCNRGVGSFIHHGADGTGTLTACGAELSGNLMEWCITV